ncbi:ABC transporter substrate-binding protein [Kribbella italica]|uniref:ABC-type Fe3+-hydroxamate transport system substrate-binding protein n=1 Tax=Kribbella italica TaxID=1540520 RepID=A0A7W9MUS2_9ACTN|nr:ABC transporter substrate-binding protein [Kribbella italica]MBB5837044.1 ABC-type Fe3+-hydroxamate transport system substrate-binding protein [Kribbella italica]
MRFDPVHFVPPADALTRRRLLAIGGGAAVLSACGSSPKPAPANQTRRISHAFELTDGLPLERILAMEPDLVVATDSLKRPDYDKLSAVVPTVGPIRSDGAYGTPWREHTRRMATIFGREERAEQVIADAETRYAETRRAHPEFAGKTLSYVWPTAPDYFLYFDVDPRVQLLLELGFELTDTAIALSKENPAEFYASVGSEGLLKYDADAIVAQSYGSEAIDAQRNKLFQSVPAVRRGALVRLPKDVADGVAFGTVLSAMAVLDDLAGLLAKVAR